jgi:hypothetical protein
LITCFELLLREKPQIGGTREGVSRERGDKTKIKREGNSNGRKVEYW